MYARSGYNTYCSSPALWLPGCRDLWPRHIGLSWNIHCQLVSAQPRTWTSVLVACLLAGSYLKWYSNGCFICGLKHQTIQMKLKWLINKIMDFYSYKGIMWTSPPLCGGWMRHVFLQQFCKERNWYISCYTQLCLCVSQENLVSIFFVKDASSCEKDCGSVCVALHTEEDRSDVSDDLLNY